MKKTLGPAFFSFEPPDARAVAPLGRPPIGPGTPTGTPAGAPGAEVPIGDGPPGGGIPGPLGALLGASRAGLGPLDKAGPGAVPPSAGPPVGNLGASRAGAGPGRLGVIPGAGVGGRAWLGVAPPGIEGLGTGGKPGVGGSGGVDGTLGAITEGDSLGAGALGDGGKPEAGEGPAATPGVGML